MKRRIGTDIFVTINLNDYDNTINLSNTYDNNLVLHTQNYPIVYTYPSITISGNTISFQYTSAENINIGPFDAIFKYKTADNTSELGYIQHKLDIESLFVIVYSSKDDDSTNKIQYNIMCNTYV